MQSENEKIAAEIGRISQAALPQIERLVQHRVNGTKREGNELVMLNPKRNDINFNSFRINTVTGKWSDFATDDSGGDFVSLIAFLDGIDQISTVIRVADEIGIAHHFTMNDHRPRHVPSQGNQTRRDFRNSKLGIPSAFWVCRHEDNSFAVVSARYEAEGDKTFRPWCWDRRKSKWVSKHLKLAPLYNSIVFATKPNAVVIVGNHVFKSAVHDEFAYSQINEREISDAVFQLSRKAGKI